MRVRTILNLHDFSHLNRNIQLPEFLLETRGVFLFGQFQIYSTEIHLSPVRSWLSRTGRIESG